MAINILGSALAQYKKIALQTAQHTLEFVGQPTLEISIKFVSKNEIQRLNR